MILDRRSFLEGLPLFTVPAAGQQGGRQRGSKYYVFEQLFFENGTQPARFHEFASKGLIPAMERVVKMTALVLEAVMAPHMPQAALIFAGESADQFKAAGDQLHADKQFKQTYDAWEAGDPPYQNNSAWFLEATAYSPEFKPLETPPASPRYFELRVYHSPTWRQLALLHERFAGPETKIFHRVGVNPILYSTTIFGPDRPSLTYVIPFDSLAAREKAWAAFGADSEWIKVRKESIDKGGQISIRSQISLYRATPYSPIR